MAQLLIPHPRQERVRLRPGAVADVISPAPRDIWAGVLRDDPGATALQTPEYFEAVLSATGGTDASRFYQLGDGRQLVLPLVRRRSRLGLHLEAGYPGGYGHGGMLATGGLLGDDVRAVVQDLRGQSHSLRIGGAHHTSEQWTTGLGPGVVEESRRVEVIDLADYIGGGTAAFRQGQFSRNLRQKLTRSVRLGVEVEVDNTGRLIPTFYDIYRSWVERSVERSGRPAMLARRLALREEPYSKFAAVAARMGDRCRVFVAWHHGRPVASCITLVHGQHAIGWRTYSIYELSAPVNANMLTQVAAIEDALLAGCRYVDLGQSGDKESLLHFKSRFGATPRPVVDLRIEPPGLTRLRAAYKRAEGLAAQVLTRSSARATADAPQA